MTIVKQQLIFIPNSKQQNYEINIDITFFILSWM